MGWKHQLVNGIPPFNGKSTIHVGKCTVRPIDCVGYKDPYWNGMSQEGYISNKYPRDNKVY